MYYINFNMYFFIYIILIYLCICIVLILFFISYFYYILIIFFVLYLILSNLIKNLGIKKIGKQKFVSNKNRTLIARINSFKNVSEPFGLILYKLFMYSNWWSILIIGLFFIYYNFYFIFTFSLSNFSKIKIKSK